MLSTVINYFFAFEMIVNFNTAIYKKGKLIKDRK